MQTEYDALASRKAQLKKIYQTAEKEATEADKQLKNIEQYLGIKKERLGKTKTDRKHEMSL